MKTRKRRKGSALPSRNRVFDERGLGFEEGERRVINGQPIRRLGVRTLTSTP